MEFGVIFLLLAVGYLAHRAFHRPRPALEVALAHLEAGSPVRAEYVAEQALRAAREGSLAAGEAGVDLATILVRVGDLRRAREVLERAQAVLGATGAPLERALALEATLDEATDGADPEPWAVGLEGEAPSDAAMRLALGAAEAQPADAEPRIADRCGGGGCGCATPAGVLDPEASRAFAELLQGGRAQGLVRAAEIRRDGDRLIPRLTVNGDLDAEQERTLERAVQGAMGVLFG